MNAQKILINQRLLSTYAKHYFNLWSLFNGGVIFQVNIDHK
jgi:hypothetical protein